MSDRDVCYYNREQKRQQFQIPVVLEEATYSEVLRNIGKEMDYADSVDLMANKAIEQNEALNKKAERQFNAMMDMISQLLAKLN